VERSGAKTRAKAGPVPLAAGRTWHPRSQRGHNRRSRGEVADGFGCREVVGARGGGNVERQGGEMPPRRGAVRGKRAERPQPGPDRGWVTVRSPASPKMLLLPQKQGQRRAFGGEGRTVAVQPLGRERYVTGCLAGLRASAFKEAMWY